MSEAEIRNVLVPDFLESGMVFMRFSLPSTGACLDQNRRDRHWSFFTVRVDYMYP